MSYVVICPSVASKLDLSNDQRKLVKEWSSYCLDDRFRRRAYVIKHREWKTIRTRDGKTSSRTMPFLILCANNLSFVASRAKTLDAAIRWAENNPRNI